VSTSHPAQGGPQPPRHRTPTAKLLLPVAGDLALELLTLLFASPLTVAQAAVLAVGDTGSPAPVLALGAVLLRFLCKGRGSRCSLHGGAHPRLPPAPPAPRPGLPLTFLVLASLSGGGQQDQCQEEEEAPDLHPACGGGRG